MGVISPPIGDICYFLYVNTDREFRSRHLKDCLQWYFDAFGSYLTAIKFRDEKVKITGNKLTNEMNK